MKLPANMLREIAGHLGHADRARLRAASSAAHRAMNRSALVDVVNRHNENYIVDNVVKSPLEVAEYVRERATEDSNFTVIILRGESSNDEIRLHVTKGFVTLTGPSHKMSVWVGKQINIDGNPGPYGAARLAMLLLGAGFECYSRVTGHIDKATVKFVGQTPKSVRDDIERMIHSTCRAHDPSGKLGARMKAQEREDARFTATARAARAARAAAEHARANHVQLEFDRTRKTWPDVVRLAGGKRKRDGPDYPERNYRARAMRRE